MDRSPEAVDLARIGPRIVDIRNQRGWTQKELCRRAGVRAARLSRLERALITPKVEELVRIARALGVGLDQLAFGEAPRPRTLELIRELESLGTPEEIAGIGRILQLLLIGYRTAGSGA